MNPSKTKQFLTYIINGHEPASVTELMKLSYLIDLVSVKRIGLKISDFCYRRYNYGPFDDKIYSYLSELSTEGVLLSRLEYTPRGDEYVVYSIDEKNKTVFDELNDMDTKIADEILEKVRGYGAKTLTEIAYKTKPMERLGATLGGAENLNVELDLNCD
jgi:hypothetical protein